MAQRNSLSKILFVIIIRETTLKVIFKLYLYCQRRTEKWIFYDNVLTIINDTCSYVSKYSGMYDIWIVHRKENELIQKKSFVVIIKSIHLCSF